jgi:hypothetical protein
LSLYNTRVNLLLTFGGRVAGTTGGGHPLRGGESHLGNISQKFLEKDDIARKGDLTL